MSARHTAWSIIFALVILAALWFMPAQAQDAPPVTVDVLPPSDAPLPAWAEEPAAAFTVPDGRIPAAQRLITLYREVIATESQYGSLTGHFSDWLAPKRELEAMIAQLEHLIHIIQHPEEVTPDA